MDKIREALQAHLKTLDPSFRTQLENTRFTPDVNVPFQRVAMIYANPDNQTLGCDRYRAIGFFQVGLHYPVGANYIAAQDKADAIIAHFKRGTVLENNGQYVLTNRTPSKSTRGIVDDRYCVIVSIYYTSDVI